MNHENEIENELDPEVDPEDFTDQYDEVLNESGEIVAGGITFDPAEILKEMDPTAYRCGLLDYVDSIGR